MKRFLAICGLITAGAGMVCVWAILFGQSRPFVDLVRAAGLSYCNAQICLRGVALGTDWKIAQEKLTPNAVFLGRDVIQVVATDFVYSITPLDKDRSVIGQIEVGPTNGFALLLGDIVGQYGTPCLVSYLISAPGAVQIRIIYPHFDVVTPRYDITNSNPFGLFVLDPGMPVEYADFYLSGDNCVLPEQNPRNINVAIWHGFSGFQLK